MPRVGVPTLAHCWHGLRQHLFQEVLERANTSPRSCWRTAPTPLPGAVGALRQHLFWRFNTPVSPSKVDDWLYFNVRITSLELILLAQQGKAENTEEKHTFQKASFFFLYAERFFQMRDSNTAPTLCQHCANTSFSQLLERANTCLAQLLAHLKGKKCANVGTPTLEMSRKH